MAKATEFPEWYNQAILVVPGYYDLYGREASEAELIKLIKQYPVFEWISFLSRILTMIAPPNDNNRERHLAIYRGISGPEFARRLDAFIANSEDGIRCPIFVEPQITTLQQMTYCHAPILGSSKFSSSADLEILCNALLITWDQMHQDRVPEGPDAALAALIQDQARRLRISAYEAGPRAYRLYQMNSSSVSPNVRSLADLFARATGESFEDYLAGGLSLAMKELNRSPQSIAEGWAPTLMPNHCPNKDESRCLGVFHKLRCGTISEIKQRIERFDGPNPLSELNLIGVRSKPIIEFGEKGRFIGNISASLDALFAGIRHAILDAIGDGRIPELSVRDLGKLYGDVFEEYVLKLIEQAFGDRYIRVPVHPSERRADGIITSPTGIIVFEVKAKFPRALDHAKLMTLKERFEELVRCGIADAAEQLAATIRALREHRIIHPLLNGIDWTVLPIVPVVITMDRLPLYWKMWPVFQTLTQSIQDQGQACPTVRARFVDVGDVEHFPDLAQREDIPARMIQWSNSPAYYERPFNDYLVSAGISFQNSFGKERQIELMRFLIDKFGLDQTQLRVAGD